MDHPSRARPQTPGQAQSPAAPRWEFVWTTGPYGWLGRTESGWVLQGRPNTTPDTGWVVAHDVFHHLPGDVGTYIEEVVTFGAESWLESPATAPEKLQEILTDSWVGVILLVLKNGTRGARGLMLPPQAPPASHPLAERWAAAYRNALIEVRSTHADLASTEDWQILASLEMVDRAVACVARGLDAARCRWPDPARARAQFEQVQKAATQAHDGDRLTVSFDGQDLVLDKTLALRSSPGSGRLRP